MSDTPGWIAAVPREGAPPELAALYARMADASSRGEVSHLWLAGDATRARSRRSGSSTAR